MGALHKRKQIANIRISKEKVRTNHRFAALQKEKNVGVLMKKKITGEFYEKLMKLMIPIVLQNLLLASVAVADAIMLGSVEQNSMSAVSLATQIQFIQNMFLAAVTSGVSILGAQYWGKGDKETMNDIFCLALRLAGTVSILTFVACSFFPGLLMRIFTNEDVLVQAGAAYLRIAGWSYLLTGLTQCYLTMMKVSEHASQTARISGMAVILNIIMNAVFIYGWFGLPAMGVQGAAIATLIARIAEFVCSVAVSGRKDFVHPDFRHLFRHNKVLDQDFAKCSMPILGACLFWGIGFTSYSAFMGHLGTDAAAANSVAAVVRDLICCFSGGIASAGGIMVGNELGAGNLEKGKSYGDRLVKIAFACGAAASLLMLAVTPLLLHFVKLTDGAKQNLTGMLIVIAVYLIGRAVNDVTINGIFAAGGDTLFDMYSLAVCMWCLAIPLAAAGTFFFHWPVVVVYACTCLDEVGKIPWVMYHYKKYRWVKDLTRDTSGRV